MLCIMMIQTTSLFCFKAQKTCFFIAKPRRKLLERAWSDLDPGIVFVEFSVQHVVLF